MRYPTTLKNAKTLSPRWELCDRGISVRSYSSELDGLVAQAFLFLPVMGD